MLTNRELELITMELETDSLSQEVYRYHTEWGISVVYYMFDLKLIDQGIFEPIYLYTDDVQCLEMPEDELFRIILKNTVNIMQTGIIPFSKYLKEIEAICEDRTQIPLIKGIAEAMERAEEQSKLWCITSTLRERGASGSFCMPLLREFCEEHKCSRLLVGFGNNDFAFLGQDNESIASIMPTLVYQIGHVVKEAAELSQSRILAYDYEADTLSNFTEE